MLLYLLLPLVAIAMLMAPLIPVYAGITTGKKAPVKINYSKEEEK